MGSPGFLSQKQDTPRIFLFTCYFKFGVGAIAHQGPDKASLITVKTVLDLAKRAKEIYESSKVDEKRQILNFLFSNLEMKDKKAIITLREPFDKLVAVSDHPKCRKR